MKQAFAIAALFLGILFESMLWDEQIMQSPDELTVSEFEQAESGLSVVLTNAIEDAREVCDHLVMQHDDAQVAFNRGVVDGVPPGEWDVLKERVEDAAEMQFRAMRVLGLLRDTREREAGQVT